MDEGECANAFFATMPHCVFTFMELCSCIPRDLCSTLLSRAYHSLVQPCPGLTNKVQCRLCFVISAEQAKIIDDFEALAPSYYARLGYLSTKVRQRTYKQATIAILNAKQQSQEVISQLRHNLDLVSSHNANYSRRQVKSRMVYCHIPQNRTVKLLLHNRYVNILLCKTHNKQQEKSFCVQSQN